MKKNKFKAIKIFSLILAITFVFSLFIIPQAKLNAKTTFEDELVVQLLSKKYKIVIPLYSAEDNLVAFYVSSGNNYYILNSVNYEIIEMSDEHNIGFIEQSQVHSERIIYISPLNYYSKSTEGIIKNQFLEVLDKYPIQATDFEDTAFKRVEVNKAELFSNRTNEYNPEFGISDHFINYSSYIPNYSYNPDNICGSTAAAMLLMYYDKVYNDSYVPNSWESSNGVYLIEKLVPFIENPRGAGSSMLDAINGLNNYLTQRGFSRTVYNRSSYSLDLRKGPAMLDLGKGIQPYGEHWVVAYGYRQFNNIAQVLPPELSSLTFTDSFKLLSPGETVSYLIFVVDGWGNRGALINQKYIEGALYLRWEKIGIPCC